MSVPTGKRKLPPSKAPAIPLRERKPDWAWIRREWESDLKTDRGIAAQSTAAGRKVSHVAIGKQAKKNGWKKASLTPAVQREIANRLARASVSAVTDANAEDVIDAAAKEGVTVVQTHRQDIRQARVLVGTMFQQLADATNHVDELGQAIEEEIAETKDAKAKAELEARKQRRARLLKTIGLQSRAGVARDLSQAMRNLIGLERQAFNIDARHEGSTLEDYLKTLDD